MRRRLLLAVVLAPLVVAPLVLAADDPQPRRVLHRVFHPSLPDAPFTPRAALHPGPSPSLVPSPSLDDDYRAFADALASHPVPLSDVLYQVALEHPADQSSAQWHVSSVKACHLARSTSEAFTVHLSPEGDPFALDYFLAPIPHNGACPNIHPDRLHFAPIANSTLSVRAPTYPPLPQLRTPPPLTPEGTVVQPVPEKSFLQKYWIYILVAVVALVMSPAPPEEGKERAK